MSTRSFAATTDEKLEACDKALYAKIEEARICDLGVKIRTDDRVSLQKENAELRKANSAWYNNPFVWGALGAILGVYAGARATR